MSDSKRWLREHFNDYYVKKAQREGYPSRAAYKLLEIQEKDHLFKPGMVVVDLGAAPGGWSKVARELVGEQGLVLSVDLLPMPEMVGVEFIQGDFNDEAVLAWLRQKIAERGQHSGVDLVLSDMASNLSGQKSIDQPRAMHLVEIAWHFSDQTLRQGGSFVAKVFEGAGTDLLIKEFRARFDQVKIRKPQSSRSRSREFYVVARGLR